MKDTESQETVFPLIDDAVGGNKEALESLLSGVQDMVFNLSLRMLGTIPDAEDATQDILVRVMTHLATFRKECAFSTWVFKIAVNHLKNYKKSMFAAHPLSFEYYGEDILNGDKGDIPDMSQEVDKNLLAEELKMSCTNVMLQCLDPDSRCIFVLGTMFKLDSRIAGEILGINPDTYRQRLSRVRKQMADFLSEYCGWGGGSCNCRKRINYAVATKRLNPQKLEYTGLEAHKDEALLDYQAAMEQIDNIALIFNNFPIYRSSQAARAFITSFLQTEAFKSIQK